MEVSARILLLSFIGFLAFSLVTSSVYAYTLGDLVNWMSSLFQAQNQGAGVGSVPLVNAGGTCGSSCQQQGYTSSTCDITGQCPGQFNNGRQDCSYGTCCCWGGGGVSGGTGTVTITNGATHAPLDNLQFSLSGFTPNSQIMHIYISPDASGGQQDVALCLSTTSGGCGGTSYLTTNSNGAAGPTQFNIGTNLGTGTRILTVVDASGVSASTTFTISTSATTTTTTKTGSCDSTNKQNYACQGNSIYSCGVYITGCTYCCTGTANCPSGYGACCLSSPCSGGTGGGAAVSADKSTYAPHATVQFSLTSFTSNQQISHVYISPDASGGQQDVALCLSTTSGGCGGTSYLTTNSNGAASSGFNIGTNLGTGTRILTVVDASGVSASTTFTISTSATTTTTTPGVSGTCTNPYPTATGTDTYGVRLCRSDYTQCSWNGNDNVQIGNADANGNIQVTFNSQTASAVNVWLADGRVVGINSQNVAPYGYLTENICMHAQTAAQCTPATLVNDGFGNTYATNLGKGYIKSSSNVNEISINNPTRALMPLYLSGGQASITITNCANVIQGCNPTSLPIALYYQFYYDTGTNAGVSSWCDTSSGSKCSASAASYTGCTGNLQNVPGQPDNTQTNSELCIHSGSAILTGNACWHYPWEIYPSGWSSLQVSLQGGGGTCNGNINCPGGQICQNGQCVVTTTTTTTTTTTVTPSCNNCQYGCCTNGCCSSAGCVGCQYGCCSGNVCCSSSTSTTSTATSTTTTTTTAPPLPITCSDCFANSLCSCSIPSDSCNNGAWTVQNQNGNPLPQPVIAVIPPNSTVYYTPNQTGSVLAKVSCFDPNNNKQNQTTVTVLQPFLVCPPSCTVNTQCSCTINNCNGGLFIASMNNNAITTQSFSTNPYTASFTATQTGTVNAIATCNNPLTPSASANIQITGTSTVTTSVTSTPPGAFTHSNFNCVQIGSKYTCTINYNNQLGQPAFLYYDVFSSAGQNVLTSPAVSIIAGSGVSSPFIIDCGSLGTGSYSVTFKVYQTETRFSPIDWSISHETQQVSC